MRKRELSGFTPDPLKSFKQIGHRRVETPRDDLQRDNSRLALATFNVRPVSPVHVEMDGEIICV
jgi:hypothetical protein